MSDQVDMAKAIAERKALEEELLPQDDGAVEIKPGFIRNCLYNNERGDGMLFAELQRGEFVHVKTTESWLYWTGHHWSPDKKDLVYEGVEAVAGKYLGIAAELKVQADEAYQAKDSKEAKRLKDERAKYIKRVDRLRGTSGANNCLLWSHRIGDASLAIIADVLDQQPMLLACKNGVINLASGRLQEGRPEDYLMRAVDVEWRGLDEPCPTWEKFIAEIHVGPGGKPDPDLASFIQRYFGYAITGLTTEHFIGCFLGEGRNGKGTMFETMRALLGELSWAVQAELLLDQKNARASAGPSPDLVSLQGRRLVIASETDEHRRVSGSKVKWLTGGDTINARAPHDRLETNFRPSHTLFLYTNHIPKGLTADFALLKRLLLISYPLKFVDDPDPSDPNQRPRDPGLPEKLAREHSGILAWLVRGCLEWQMDGGLKPPPSIRAEVEQLRVSEDTFQQFFDQYLEAAPTDDQGVAFGVIYKKFSEWYEEEISEQTKYRPSKIKISKWLEKRGFERHKPGGVATFRNITFKVALP